MYIVYFIPDSTIWIWNPHVPCICALMSMEWSCWIELNDEHDVTRTGRQFSSSIHDNFITILETSALPENDVMVIKVNVLQWHRFIDWQSTELFHTRFSKVSSFKQNGRMIFQHMVKTSTNGAVESGISQGFGVNLTSDGVEFFKIKFSII